MKVVKPREDESEAEGECVRERQDQEDADDEDEAGEGEGQGQGKGNEVVKLDPDDISKGAVAAEPESTGADVDGKMKGKVDIKKGDELKLGRRLGTCGQEEDGLVSR